VSDRHNLMYPIIRATNRSFLVRSEQGLPKI